jgi:hypothetical protein
MQGVAEKFESSIVRSWDAGVALADTLLFVPSRGKLDRCGGYRGMISPSLLPAPTLFCCSKR